MTEPVQGEKRDPWEVVILDMSWETEAYVNGGVTTKENTPITLKSYMELS